MISSIPKWVSNLFGNAMNPNVKVLEVTYLSSQIKKIRFQGDILKWNFQIGYASVVRVSETEFRNYTIAHHDTENGFFDIIFHIHGNGIGSNYMDSLSIGDEIFVSPPRGLNLYNSNAKHQFLFGDETSLGLAFSFFSILKQNGHQYQFYFEFDDENKNVPNLLGLDNCVIFQKNGTFKSETQIYDLPVFQSLEWKDASYILTGNVKSVQAFRKAIKSKTQSEIHSQGYWLEGKKGL
jgi:NADPH-dependent ferric siderophore reductase